MGLDVHPGMHQSQLMSSGQSESSLLPPPAHPQHIAPPHIEVAHAAGMIHLGGLPVSQSPAYIDSSATMMISPGPPPPVATMVTMSHLSNQQSHDPESYVQHHHQQQQHEIQLQQQQHHRDDEHNQQQQLASQMMHATANNGNGVAATMSDEGTMTPVHTPQHHVVIPQHVLATGYECVTPEAGTPEPSTIDTQHQQQIVVTVQDGANESTNVLCGSHLSSVYQASVDAATVHSTAVCASDQAAMNPEDVSNVHQMTAVVVTGDEYSNPLQQQQKQEPETASMTCSNVTANHDTSSSALVEERVTVATEPGNNQSDIARLSTSPTDE